MVKTYKSIANQKIGEGKRTAFQKLVNIFSEKKEMKWYEMNPDLRVKNIGPESAPRHSLRFKPVIITPPTPETPMIMKPNGISRIKER